MLVVAWLWAALQGESCRSRAFLVEQGITVPPRDDKLSWSDQQDVDRIRPGYQLLARWRNKLADRATAVLPLLVVLCSLFQIDLKAASEALTELKNVPVRLNAAALVLGLMRALRGELQPGVSVSLEECVPYLLEWLVECHFNPSHGVGRASGGRPHYHSLVL
jgi:hypothetical protein